MPLIETVTYPEMLNPDEVKEACDYIRFLGRSTGLVRTGIGAGRQDVNVSCKGGTRVEIKGVAHTKWIPELTHNECFRQWALLKIKEILLSRMPDPAAWKMSHKELSGTDFNHQFDLLKNVENSKLKLYAVNLPGFHGILSHFTQPEQSFASEISDRLKVIACIEKPNMTHSEAQFQLMSDLDMRTICSQLNSNENDAQILFWGPEEDIKTALEVIEERCRMAFQGVPNETRKALTNGTTIFERVLPGADRMYPDTDSAPIPLADSDIDRLGQNLPTEVIDRYKQMKQWGIPEDAYTYIFSHNHFPLIQSIITECGTNPSFTGTFFGHVLKFVEGHYKPTSVFRYEQIKELFDFLKKNKLDVRLAKQMLPLLYEHPKMDFDSILVSIGFKKVDKEELFSKIPYLVQKFSEIRRSDSECDETNWIMGQLRKTATGNVNLKELYEKVTKK
jgi:glutamyl-tRNA(Gln) amidotransferase subunit E